MNPQDFAHCKSRVICTAWCSEIGSLTSLAAPEFHAYGDVKEPISLHQAVFAERIQRPLLIHNFHIMCHGICGIRQYKDWWYQEQHQLSVQTVLYIALFAWMASIHLTLYRRIFQLLEGSSLAFALKEQYLNNYTGATTTLDTPLERSSHCASNDETYYEKPFQTPKIHSPEWRKSPSENWNRKSNRSSSVELLWSSFFRQSTAWILAVICCTVQQKIFVSEKFCQKRPSGSSSGIYFRQTSGRSFRLRSFGSLAYRLSSHSWLFLIPHLSFEENLVRNLI